jgi:toxin ParE1/3/4
MAEYGGQVYGLAAAEAYLAEMQSLFDLLAANPYMSRERTETGRPLRLHRFKAHHILYTVVDEDVLIVRVVGAMQDWQNLDP